VAWSIEAAIACRRIDLIIVSSNCPEVEKVTKTYDQCRWLHFLPRPDEIAGDVPVTEDAMLHALDYTINEVNLTPHWVTLLQPTSPVRNERLLDRCCESVLDSSLWDSLITCSIHSPFFYKMSEAGGAVSFGHDPCDRPMRQSMTKDQLLGHDAGNIYLTRAEIFLERKCRVGLRPYLMPLSNFQAWQIDVHEDFTILESMSLSFGPFV